MRLRLIVNVLMLFMTFVFFIMPAADAWSWKTHSDIVDVVYNGLPVDVQQKLNLNAMRDGSNDPDQIFKDFRYHSYPKSYGKAKMWLDKGKTAYYKGNYNEASYDYGVASHYISDTFSAPHAVSGEDYNLHQEYEDQAKNLKPTATYISGDLNTLMHNGYNQGSISWNEWLQTKNSAIIQKNLNTAASVSLSAIKDSINSKPSYNILSLIYNFILNLFHLNQ